MSISLILADLQPADADALGQLLIDAYSQLEGFPSAAEQPHYYVYGFRLPLESAPGR